MAATTGGAIGLNLEKELICFICTEIMYQPLTLLDCLHSFCGSCLKSWFQLQHHKACSSHSSTSSATNPYTCPTCRATVKAARPNAMVNTWLELYLTAHPERGPSQEDKDEKLANYNPGDDILPKVVRGRRRERRSRRDEGEALERRMIEEAQERSLREITMHSTSREESLQPPPDPHQSQSSRSRERNREREERRARRREAERQRRHRVQVAETEVVEHQEDIHNNERERSPPVLPPVSSPRHPDAVEARQRQQRIMHQTSLISLISSSEGSTGSSLSDNPDIEALRDMIVAEGLLDGIDMDALTDAEENILVERVVEAFKQRRNAQQQQQQQQQEEGQQAQRGLLPRSPTRNAHLASDDAINIQSDVTDRSLRDNSTNGQRRAETLPLPTVRPGQSDRPQSSRTLLTDGTTTPPSVSVVLAQRLRRLSNQSQSNFSARNRSGQSNPSRPEVRSAVDLAIGPHNHEQTSGNRMIQSLIASGASIEPQSSPMSSDISLPAASPAQILPENSAVAPAMSSPKGSIAELPGSGPSSPRPTKRTMSLSGSQALVHFDEPSIMCFRCHRSDIQYEVHKHCHQCNVDLCLRCYRKARGCNYWFGFSGKAMDNFKAEQANMDSNQQVELPHVLVGRSLRRPHQSLVLKSKMAKDGFTVVPLKTMADPTNRMLEGLFCDRCGNFADSCFWSCYWCNSGEWGFCNDCVNTHHCCTHPLLPIAHGKSSSNGLKPFTLERKSTSPGLVPEGNHTASLAATSPETSRPGSATSALSATIGPFPGYLILNINTHCDVCGQSIHPTYLRYHCPFHQSTASNSDKNLGDYDICTQCYHNLVKTNRIKRDDGPAGWRRCPSGHRMIMTTFKQDWEGSYRRVISNDLVGGRLMSEVDMETWMDVMTKNRDSGTSSDPSVDPAETSKDLKGTWRWREDQSSDKRSTRERKFSVSAHIPANSSQTSQVTSSSSTTQYNRGFPPEGGFGSRRSAKWSYFPEDGDTANGELQFPRLAEIQELENVNGDWWQGVYAGDIGLVPISYMFPEEKQGTKFAI